jgi:metal-responsive CopG/Arc/MetJ family transcriptional regulator
MPVKKIAISVPPDVIRQVDLAARERGVTRSRFITDLLRKAARARSDAEVTRRLNELFADPEVAAEQRREARMWVQAMPKDGWEW